MSEWVEKPLAELASIQVSNVDKKTIEGEKNVRLCNYMDVYSNDYLDNEIDYMEATASRKEVSRFSLAAGDVVITKDSESPDDIGIPATLVEEIEGLVCGYHLALLRPDLSKVDPIFLLKQLASAGAASYFGKRAAGSTRYALSTGTISNTPIPVAPLKEQRKISFVLRLLDTRIEATEALIAKQERLRAGLMQDLFTRGVDENGELRPPREEAPHLYHKTELGWLPKGWTAKAVSDCVDSISDGPFGSNLKSEHYVTEPGVRVIRLQNVQAGYFDASDQAFVSDDHARYLARFEVRPEDVLIASLGDDRFEAGRACLYPEDLGPAINKADCFRARAARDVVCPFFLMSALNSEHARRGKLRLVQGVTRQRINTGNYKALLVPIPDLQSDEQSQIVQLLQKADLAQNEALDALLEIRRLKFGLMQDLLTGTVSVAPLLQKEPA